MTTRPPSKRPAKTQPPSEHKTQRQPVLTTETMTGILDTLDAAYQYHPMNDVTEGEPFKVLIGTILSLRTNDDVTIPACARLFKVADTPEKILALPVESLQTLIYPVGFYKTKAETLRTVSQVLLDEYDGHVPNTVEELLKLKGVGRKTANLVVGLGHKLPAICVDTHVHRMCNRMGYLVTKTPDDTEFALRDKLPVDYWRIINRVMVLHGREVCKPIGARCDICVVASLCHKIEVKARKVPKPSTSVTQKLYE